MYLASFSGLLHLQFLIACSVQKWKEKAWGISSSDPRYNHHTSSHLLSIAKWCMRLILHSVLATKKGKAPAESYTERMEHTQAKSHDSKRLRSDKRENTQQWCNHFGAKRQHYLELHHIYHSHPSAFKLQTWKYLRVGLTSPLNMLLL